MDRIRAIWVRWRIRRAERLRRQEEGHVGQTVYTGSSTPGDKDWRDAYGAGSGGGG